MDEHRQRFGQQIRNARKAAHLSRDTVSEKAEITLKYLGEIERGEKWPSFEVAIKIARVLGVSPIGLSGRLAISDRFEVNSKRHRSPS